MSPAAPTRLAGALLLALSLAACRDGTGPGSLTIAGSGSLDYPARTERLADGTPYLRCVATYRLQASGPGEATWTGGVLRFYAGPTRGTPVDSAVFTADEVAEAFDTPLRVSQRSVLESHWNIDARIPLFFDAEFSYRPDGGSERSVTVPLRCGPPLPGGSFTTTVQSVTVTAPPDGLERGDTLVVQVLANSPGTIWRTMVTLDGPCRVSAEAVEDFATSVARTMRLVIPATCAYEVPFTVVASVVDGIGETTSRSEQTDIRLVDVTAPALTLSFMGSPSGVPQPRPVGAWIVGDSLTVFGGVSDAGGLASLSWEVLPSGARDSVAVTGTNATARMPLGPSWVGATSLRVVARDQSGNASAPAIVDLSAMRVLPVAPVAVRTTGIVGEAFLLAPDPAHDLVWVASSTRATAVSRTSLLAVRTVILPAQAAGIDVTPSGDTLLVSFRDTRTLGVVDLTRQSTAVVQLPVASLDSAGASATSGVFAMADGRVLLRAINASGAGVAMHEYDLATRTSRRRTDVALADVAHAVRSGDARVLVVGDFARSRWQRWTTATDAFAAPATVTGALAAPRLDGTGARLTMGALLLHAAFAPVRSLERIPGMTAFEPSAALASDGAFAYLSPGSGVFRARTSDGALVDGLRLGTQVRLAMAWPGSSQMIFIGSAPPASSTTVTFVDP